MKTQRNDSSESVSSDVTDWSAIKWYKIEKYIDKLQKRIYHAESVNDYRKVRGLQRTLFRSNAALLLSIRRVTQKNKGKRTPGIDGVRVLSDKERGKLFDTMKHMNIKLHNPKPAYRKYILKKNGKYRSLGIPVIKDRIYQEITRMALEPQAEAKFEPTSYGFRPRRRPHDAVKRIMYNIQGGNWCWVFEGDFKSCFDTLDHDFILKQIKGFPLYDLVEKFLKAGYVDNDVFYNTNKGTPQGAILSPLLANIALDGMEKVLNITYEKYTDKNGKTTYRSKGKYRVVRYADDFVIFAKSKEDIDAIPEILVPYLNERGLELAEDKTRIIHICKGFDFLGFNFRRYKTKDGFIHLSKPSKDSIMHFKSKIMDIFRTSHGHNVGVLIKRLNPLIRGTANYWKPTVAKEIFAKLDHYLWEKTMKFLKRLHHNKPLNEIVNKYFPLFDNGKHKDKWVLQSPKEGQYLIKMAWIPIVRHIMIKFNYSPFDKSKSKYFDKR